jgi:glycosyltransferase involved in cell wall biosynthesis
MRVVICWTHFSGYMAACWQALSKRPGVELSVLAMSLDATWQADFDPALLSGIDCRLLSPAERADGELVRDLVLDKQPDVVVLPGWFYPAYRALAFDPALASKRRVMTMDTAWDGSLRQQLARVKIGRFLKHIDAVIVAGERAWQFARRLGFGEGQIYRGLYGFDAKAYGVAGQKRAAYMKEGGGNWPRKFLFCGRYVADKGLDVLWDAYARYRGSHGQPWPLTCCGTGAQKAMLAGVAGLEDVGFKQPGELPGLFAEHGALILPSRFEPWGVTVAEAMGAQLPVVVSEAVGSNVELVRHLYNGLIVPTNDAAALARALATIHEMHGDLPEMGRRGSELAQPFAAEQWARHWHEVFLGM